MESGPTLLLYGAGREGVVDRRDVLQGIRTFATSAIEDASRRLRAGTDPRIALKMARLPRIVAEDDSRGQSGRGFGLMKPPAPQRAFPIWVRHRQERQGV